MKLLITTLLTVLQLAIAAQDYTIDHFAQEITISADGSLDIVEKIDVYFHTKKRGIIRSIPYKYSFEDQQIDIALTKISVDNQEYKVSKQGRNRTIRIGNPDKYLTGKQTYHIRYTASYPIINHERYQELYWNVTGNEWDTEIKKADLTIHLPKDLALATDDLLVWTGPKGATEQLATFRQENTTTLQASSKQVLKAGEGMTVALKMPLGFLTIPENSQINSTTNNTTAATSTDSKPWWLALPLALFAGLLTWWKSMRAKEIVPMHNKKYEHYPPEGLTSAHVGAFIDHRVHRRDIMSLIPYWAAEGFITMADDDGIVLKKIKDLPHSFPNYELEMFQSIFAESDQVDVAKVNGSLQKATINSISLLQKEISIQDYYDENYQAMWSSKMTLAMVLAPVLAAILSFFVLHNMWLGIGFGLMAVGVIVLASFTAPLSPIGKNLMARLLAFRAFLEDTPAAEISQLLKNDTLYFDKVFPFAVAFGLDESWLKAVEPHMEATPSWYQHSRGNSFSYFQYGYDSAAINKSFTVNPATVSSGGGFSSNSSGSSGSSGGGFGGGGGSSW